MITANVVTESRKVVFYLTEANDYAARKKQYFAHHTNNFTETPRTIAYKKEGDFFNLLRFNAPTDQELLQEKLRT